MTDTNAMLKPCPFCGGEAEIERRGNSKQSTIYACTDCGCRLETAEGGNYGARWNTRAASAPAVADVRAALTKIGHALAIDIRNPYRTERDRIMEAFGLVGDALALLTPEVKP